MPRGPWRLARVAFAFAALFAATARAQADAAGGGSDVAPRLVAVHFQALPPDPAAGPFAAEVALPPPRLGTWEAVTAETEAGCLDLLGVVRDDGDGHPVLRLGAGRGPGGLGPGDACAGTVVLRFSGGGTEEAVEVGVAFYRPAAPAYTGTGLRPGYSVDRVARGDRGPDATHPPAPYVDLAVVNETGSAVRVAGLVGLEDLRRLRFEAFRLPGDGFPTSLAGLEPLAKDAAVELSPGETFRVAIVVDPAADISQDAGAASVQPAVLVEVGGELRTLRFDLVTVTWGVD